jgi:hypothetical protein
MERPRNGPSGAAARGEGRAGRARLDRIPRATVATHRALFVDENERRCDVCDAVIPEGAESGGSGLLIWTRGEETRFEEPPLCDRCGPELATVAFRRWDQEEEEEG